MRFGDDTVKWNNNLETQKTANNLVVGDIIALRGPLGDIINTMDVFLPENGLWWVQVVAVYAITGSSDKLLLFANGGSARVASTTQFSVLTTSGTYTYF